MAINPFIGIPDGEDDQDVSHKLVETADGRLHLFSHDTSQTDLDRFKWRYDNGQDVSRSANMPIAQPLHSFTGRQALQHELTQPALQQAKPLYQDQPPASFVSGTTGLLSGGLPAADNGLLGSVSRPDRHAENKFHGVMSDLQTPGDSMSLAPKYTAIENGKASAVLHPKPKPGHPDYSQFPAGPDWASIGQNEEIGKVDGYIPEGGSSGVTIATGFDLGQWDVTTLKGWGLPRSLIDKLKPWLQMPRSEALGKYKKGDLWISPEESNLIDVAVAKDSYKRIANRFNRDQTIDTRFEDLPPDAQTAIMDLAHQYGSYLWLRKDTKKFWTMATSGRWENASDQLVKLGYPQRGRARRIDRAIQENSLPRPSGWIVPEFSLPPKI